MGMMKTGRWGFGSLILLALAAIAGADRKAVSPVMEPGFRSLFNGVDLKGWDGLPGVWSVEDGAITSEADGSALTAAVARGEWMALTLVIKGRRLLHYVNGVQTADVLDDDDVPRARSGVLALQVHGGEPMMVQFKDIRLKASRESRR